MAIGEIGVALVCSNADGCVRNHLSCSGLPRLFFGSLRCSRSLPPKHPFSSLFPRNNNRRLTALHFARGLCSVVTVMAVMAVMIILGYEGGLEF